MITLGKFPGSNEYPSKEYIVRDDCCLILVVVYSERLSVPKIIPGLILQNTLINDHVFDYDSTTGVFTQEKFQS